LLVSKLACGKLRATVASDGSSVTFGEFWPAYVRAHSKPATRVVHCVGTLVGWMLAGGAIAVHRWWWLVAALVISYALAWLSHCFVEHNRPATFEHPLWSWWADQRMVFLMLIGRMGGEVRKYGGSRVRQ
jgi:hypothetical protein